MGEISAGMDVTCGDDNLHANHSIFWIFGFYFLVLDGGQPKIDCWRPSELFFILMKCGRMP